MYLRKADDYWGSRAPLAKSEEYGGTPLDQALVVSHHLVKEFKNKHRVEKMNFVTFTDGDSGTMHAIQDEKMASKKVSSRSYRGERIIIINNIILNFQDPIQNLTLGYLLQDSPMKAH